MNAYNKIETDSHNYREQTSCYGGGAGVAGGEKLGIKRYKILCVK